MKRLKERIFVIVSRSMISIAAWFRGRALGIDAKLPREKRFKTGLEKEDKAMAEEKKALIN